MHCSWLAATAGVVNSLFSREKWEPDEAVLRGAEADGNGRLTVKTGGHSAWRVAGALFPFCWR